jgi:type II secretory pathway predicted ATPase ExeA
MQRIMIAECEDIQRGADEYADRVLSDMEAQFTEMMRVIRNGRQQIQVDSAAKAAETANFARRIQERLGR